MPFQPGLGFRVSSFGEAGGRPVNGLVVVLQTGTPTAAVDDRPLAATAAERALRPVIDSRPGYAAGQIPGSLQTPCSSSLSLLTGCSPTCGYPSHYLRTLKPR